MIRFRKLDLFFFIMTQGDISPQRAIREKLQCKSFKWFMENVAYDLLKKFPLPSDNKVWGEVCFLLLLFELIDRLSIFIKSVKAVNSQNNVCLDVRGADFGQPIGVSGCHHQLGNQVIRIHFESLPILLSNLFS